MSQVRELKDGNFALEYLHQARHYKSVQNYGKAFAFYLLLIKLFPSMKSELQSEFCLTWHSLSEILRKFSKYKELFNLHAQACEIYQGCPDIHLIVKTSCLLVGHSFQSCNYYKSAVIQKDDIYSCEYFDNFCSGLVDIWHYAMLNDIGRNRVYQAAIQHVIRDMIKDDCVSALDIGSGTGILSMFAAQAGALNVVACESNAFLSELGMVTIHKNGFGNNIASMNCWSSDIIVDEERSNSENSKKFSIPRKVSLVITETLDAGVFGEKIIENVAHAWKHLLLPQEQGGIVIPATITAKCVCCESEEILRKHRVMDDWIEPYLKNILIVSGVGIEVEKSDTAVVLTKVEPYTTEKLGKINHLLLSDYTDVTTVDFNNRSQLLEIMQEHDKPLEVEVLIKQNGYLDAICTAFHLTLVKDNPLEYVLRSDVSNTCWEQAIYPVRTFNCSMTQLSNNRIQVTQGDTVYLKFNQNADKISLASLEIKGSEENNLSNPAIYEQTMKNNNEYPCLKVVLDEATILYINDSLFWGIYCKAFSSWYQKNQACQDFIENPIKVLIISTCFSPLCIYIAKNFTNVCVFYYSPNKDVGNCMKSIAKHLDIHNLDTLSHPSQITDFKALLFNPVEADSGCLNRTVLESLQQARLPSHQQLTFFPVSVDVMIFLIESEELMKQCSVVNDSNTMGFKIGEFLNKFQVSTFSHFKLDKLSYKAFSEPKYALALDFDSNYHVENTIWKKISFKPTISGTAHAAVVSFTLKVDDSNYFDTCDPSNSFHQSAKVFPLGEGLPVVSGHFINLCVSCRGSYITVQVTT